MKSKLKQYLIVVTIFISGLALGIVTTRYLSSVSKAIDTTKPLQAGTNISHKEKALATTKIYVVQQNEANNYNIEVDLSLLASIPAERQAALAKMKKTESGSTPEIIDRNDSVFRYTQRAY
jgi:hypothetical protein